MGLLKALMGAFYKKNCCKAAIGGLKIHLLCITVTAKRAILKMNSIMPHLRARITWKQIFVIKKKNSAALGTLEIGASAMLLIYID
jgi:hypothetical protein